MCLSDMGFPCIYLFSLVSSEYMCRDRVACALSNTYVHKRAIRELLCDVYSLHRRSERCVPYGRACYSLLFPRELNGIIKCVSAPFPMSSSSNHSHIHRHCCCCYIANVRQQMRWEILNSSLLLCLCRLHNVCEKWQRAGRVPRIQFRLIVPIIVLIISSFYLSWLSSLSLCIARDPSEIRHLCLISHFSFCLFSSPCAVCVHQMAARDAYAVCHSIISPHLIHHHHQCHTRTTIKIGNGKFDCNGDVCRS